MLRDFSRSARDESSASRAGIVVTDTNLNPVLQFVAWLLLALTTLMLGSRFLTRFFLKSNQILGLEEILIVTAYLLSVGQSVTWLVPEGRIFGKQLSDITQLELQAGLKAGYARDILLSFSLGLAKLSVCTCFLTLAPDSIHRKVTYVLASILVLWTVATVLATAFQCGTQGPWTLDRSKCYDQRAFLQYTSISNAVTDAALVAFPIAMVWPLRLPLKTRATVGIVFGARVVVIIPAIFQLVYLPRLFEDDFTRRGFPYYLSLQFLQSTSVSAACIVYLGPLLRSLKRPHAAQQYENDASALSQVNTSKDMTR